MTDMLDALARLSLFVSALAIAALVAVIPYEVVSRSLFNHPSMWVFDSSGYLLCLAALGALPVVVNDGVSISITLLTEKLEPHRGMIAAMVIECISGATCLVVSLAALYIAIGQFRGGVETVAAFRIPKWWLTGMACYGFGLSGTLHLRRAWLARFGAAGGGQRDRTL